MLDRRVGFAVRVAPDPGGVAYLTGECRTSGAAMRVEHDDGVGSVVAGLSEPVAAPNLRSSRLERSPIRFGSRCTSKMIGGGWLDVVSRAGLRRRSPTPVVNSSRAPHGRRPRRGHADQDTP